jgi:crotonobetainyl-CoA:carnitine CoA-transferase CaiB-like acyl-CoA transferase
MPGSTILSDLKIVDMTTVIMGPYCTQTLADLGADVVKVEPARGDDFRYMGKPARTRGMGPCHLTLNRGKKSVSWDIRKPEGQAKIRSLIGVADILIHNIRPDGIARLGLDYDTVRTMKEDIVYVQCSGFGVAGAYGGQPAYDDLIQALSGMASLLPRVDGQERPRFLPSAIADKVSGLHAVYATLAALRHRDRTGEAVFVEVPMFEIMTHFLLEEHLAAHTFVPPNGPICYSRQIDPARQPMRTADGWIVVAPYSDDRWLRFFDVTGHQDVLSDPRFATQRDRHLNFAGMASEMAKILVRQPTSYWLTQMAKADIPAARVNDIADLTEDPHLKSVDFFQTREHPTEGPYLEIQPPIRFADIAQREIPHAPLIGQHNSEFDRLFQS